MMKALKKKLHRGEKAEKKTKKKSLRATADLKQKRKTESTIDINLTSCLKKSDYDTDGSISEAKKSESDSIGFSKGSSAVDSVAGRTVTTSGCSSRSKKVRFNIVEIRQYERIASDNPCCSSGPPIGIGWNCVETQTSSINDYERGRGSRKLILDTVLNRNEREALLLEWGVDTKTIAASTRAAIKTKFQRKQTVVNTRKFSKLEETIELTSRRLKNALFPKKRIDDEANGLLELATSQIFESDYSKTGETGQTISTEYEENKSQVHVTEPDEDIFENLMTRAFDIPTDDGLPDDGDDNVSNSDQFTLGATTLGNTSALSPSIIEIEKFYRDLELEMFGEDTELPSMVGQTLEVPQRNSISLNSSRSDGFDVHDEISIDKNFCSTYESTYLEKHPSKTFPEKTQKGTYDNCGLSDAEGLHTSNTSLRTRVSHNDSHENHFDRFSSSQGTSPPLHVEYEPTRLTPINPLVKYNDFTNSAYSFPITRRRTMSINEIEDDPHYRYCPLRYDDQWDLQRETSRPPRRRNGSFDSSYDIAQYDKNNRGSFPFGPTHHYARSYFQPQCRPSVSSSLDATNLSSGCIKNGIDRTQQSFLCSSRSPNFDEPLVRHRPLHGHLSANQWMDGTDRERSYCKNTIVTITEDAW